MKSIVLIVAVLASLTIIILTPSEDITFAMYLMRFLATLTIIGFSASVLFAGFPDIFSEKCSKCGATNSMVTVEEERVDKFGGKKYKHKYKECKQCGNREYLK